MDTIFDNYASPDEYFADHPEEEDAFYDEIAQLEEEKGPVDFPEDWPMIEGKAS